MPPETEDRPSKQVCDWCRGQKVKCKPIEDSDIDSARQLNIIPCCQRCYRRKERCTFTYTLKKPGRPSNGLSQSNRDSRSASPEHRRRAANAGRSVQAVMNGLVSPNFARGDDETGDGNDSSSLQAILPSQINVLPDLNVTGSVEQYLGGSVVSPAPDFDTDHLVSALRQATPQFHFPPGHLSNATLPLNFEDWTSTAFRLPEDAVPPPASISNGASASGNVIFGTPSSVIPPSNQYSSTILEDSPSDSAILASLKLNAEPGSFMPIDVIAPWSDICFFISLHMRHQHSLVPIVHRPSFANDLLHRRDQKDENFRGFLASIVAYVICQSPMSLVGQQHTRERLKRILFRAHRFSRACQLRNSHQPSLPMLASVILDLISTQATDDTTSTDMLAAEARRLVYALRVNVAEPREGMTLIEKEISHRMYWEVVAIEKTLALNGAPIMLHEMEGVPPLPIAVDDEYISEELHFPQPANKRSYMTGFIIIAKMFRILGQCLQRHRMFLQDPGIFDNPDATLLWIEEALGNLRSLTEDVPIPTSLTESFTLDVQADQQSWWGIQCANIHITALCTQFACIDFRSALEPSHDSPPQRQIVAKRAYDILSSIPIECLASNGQSLRGKILRVVLSLISLASDPNDMGANVWDWWNLRSIHSGGSGGSVGE